MMSKPERFLGLLIGLAMFLLSLPEAPAASENRDDVEQGIRAIDRQEYDAAIGFFSSAASAHPDGPTLFLLGDAYVQRGFRHRGPENASYGDARAAIRALTRALAWDPHLKGIRAPQRLYEDLALAYEAVGSPEKAVQYYRKAIDADPDDPIPPLYAARLRYRAGDLDKSTANLNLSLERARRKGREEEIRALMDHDPVFMILKPDP